MGEIRGHEMMELLMQQISAHRDGITQPLRHLCPVTATLAWFDTVRAIEEFINLPLFELDDQVLEQAIVTLPVINMHCHPRRLKAIQRGLAYHFSEPVAARFMTTLLQAAAIGASFAMHGLYSAAEGFRTVAHLIGYFQSRRRHFVALLYTLPAACRGNRSVSRLDTLNLFLPLIEHSGLTLTGLFQQVMLAHVFSDYALRVDATGFAGNREFPVLDKLFLEPERAAISEMQSLRGNQALIDAMEPVNPSVIFSTAELRNNIRLIDEAYAEFNLAGTNFQMAANFVNRVTEFCEDDYWVNISRPQFESLADEVGLKPYMRLQMIHQGADYVSNTDAFAPFLEIGDDLRSSVTLLSRFLYYQKNICLNKTRRFQIRSGFILENSVSEAINKQGFIIENIKRINRKEFDVVATRGSVIFNVQCKNNNVDLSQIETDLKRFVRYNRHLDRYYERALQKERDREHLLVQKLSRQSVQHIIISRFPVATDNPRVLPFSRIEEFSALATRLQNSTVN